ncbi:hypothetical protein F3Y22_tig00111164pilonHSYRG00005 [Hibiscus syriacus]|uniref:RNase H type-1 domain-containing protein n=1 Tax=Hibiscus syriacus TaxID=106335 RepID=A0A6A2YY96_HIBSY|nr:hypothetical protein F3Y22_tig00111164pilonHSYRG00005 [Hibiscus syriacus]
MTLNFSSRPPNAGAKYVAYNYHDLMFAPYGSRWQLLRKIISVHLFSRKAMDDFGPVRQEEIRMFVRALASEKAKKNRNDTVFSNNSHSVNAICCRSINWARYYIDRGLQTDSNRISKNIPHQWTAPDQGWISLNVDGAVSTRTGHGTIGWVFGDADGAWLLGFIKSIGIVQPLQAELWAIFIVLQIAWEQGFELLLLQTDSLEAAKLLEQSDVASSSLSLVIRLAAKLGLHLSNGFIVKTMLQQTP